MARQHIQTIKPLNPRQSDQKYTGDEPTWELQPLDEDRTIRLTKAFTWYSTYYTKKDAKEMVSHWLDHNDRKSEAKKYRAAPESAVNTTTIGWIARMSLVGLQLSEKELSAINEHVNGVVKQEVVVSDIEETAVTNKPNIQDRLKEKVRECGAEIDGLFDEFLREGCKLTASFKPSTILRSMNIQSQHIGIIVDQWNKNLGEFNEVLAKKDEQLNEGYAHLTAAQIKQCIKFCELVINDCGSYVQHKKAERKPRAKKAVSAEKLTAKFKVSKACDEFNIKGEPAAKLANASEAWLYRTDIRKLIHVTADPHLSSFTVKGSSVVGFDAATTEMKTLRNPAVQLKEIMTSGKPQARKVFKDIKTTGTKWNGRSHENMVILRVW